LMKPVSERPLMKKAALVTSEPALPPAPTIPDTTPRAGLETKGTMPKQRPSDIWTASENKMNMRITTPIVPELEMQSPGEGEGVGGGGGVG